MSIAVWVDAVLTLDKNTCYEAFWKGMQMHEENVCLS